MIDIGRTVAGIALLSLVAGISPAASTGVLTEQLKERQGRIDTLLETPSEEMSKEQKDRLADVLAESFDFEAMARAALKRNWDEREAAERAEFVSVFRRLVRANSVKSVDVYRSTGIEYGDEKVDGDAGEVKTVIASDNSVTDVEYSFRLIGGQWRVVDYVIDGVSAVHNYRRQFRKILRDHDWAELLRRVSDRAAELESEI